MPSLRDNLRTCELSNTLELDIESSKLAITIKKLLHQYVRDKKFIIGEEFKIYISLRHGEGEF